MARAWLKRSARTWLTPTYPTAIRILYWSGGNTACTSSNGTTGRSKKQADVDADEQLSAYALATAMGAVLDPTTKEAIPPATKLTLYFTENDLSLSTTRSAGQLDEFRQSVLVKARRIRGGDFAATPDMWRCGRCDYRMICPSRFGSERAVS